MPRQWTAPDMLQLISGYQGACVLAAAADLDLFSLLAPGPFSAADAARKLNANLRGMTVLLDALTALDLLDKRADQYHVPPDVAQLLTPGPGSILAMSQHQANCMRRWTQLAWIVKSGKPAERRPSIRGEAADYASFIEAMDNIAAAWAPKVVADIQPLPFTRLLDIGGGSGTWTIAFLASQPAASATIFDLPHVIPQAEARIASAGLAGRVRFAAGSFYTDPLPAGADLALLSAIVHQNSRQQNRDLFAKAFAALVPGGRLLIRDLLMDDSRTTPVAGALFAINMLSATEGGGTFTVAELSDDLGTAGFVDPTILRNDGTMNAMLVATRP